MVKAKEKEMNTFYKKPLIIVAFSPVGIGLSGGDRIFIEVARNFSSMGGKVDVITWGEGLNMCKRNRLSESEVRYKVIDMHFWPRLGFFINYFARILYGILWALFVKLDVTKTPIIYSASEFWMDVFPSWILKIRYGKKITLVTTWFQTAPNPLRGFAEGDRQNRYRVRAFLYWAAQLPSKFLITHFTDFVAVNNEDERKRFPDLNKKNRIFVLIGAVDVEGIGKWIKEHGKMKKKFDAVFQGRFHPQKGVVELIEIWEKVTRQKKDAKLAMIGDGPLMDDVKRKVKEMKLEKNIELLGYVFDGDKKYTIFNESKVVVHPALYDSGGMASAEAMVFGLPCVGFDLISYQSYYPKGMVKVKIGDTGTFAEAILELLRDEKKFLRYQEEAVEFITLHGSWRKRTEEFMRFVS